MPVEVEAPPRVDVGKLLLDVERERLGAVGGVLKKAHVQDRSGFPVLLPGEVQAVLSEKRLGVSEDEVLNQRAVKKLADAGILWREGEERSEFSRDIFSEDASPGLSELEQDVIRLQVWSFLHGVPYNSTLLPVGRLESVKASLKEKADGSVDETEFLVKTLELAESLDDLRDFNGTK
jgi:hypothetical protein